MIAAHLLSLWIWRGFLFLIDFDGFVIIVVVVHFVCYFSYVRFFFFFVFLQTSTNYFSVRFDSFSNILCLNLCIVRIIYVVFFVCCYYYFYCNHINMFVVIKVGVTQNISWRHLIFWIFVKNIIMIIVVVVVVLLLCLVMFLFYFFFLYKRGYLEMILYLLLYLLLINNCVIVTYKVNFNSPICLLPYSVW